jgi:N-formylglutamate deformylase
VDRSRLPVVISVPHGGTEAPPESRSLCLLDQADFAEDGDTWSRELYSFSDEVAAFVDTGVPRAIVDMNRAIDDRPPANPDGVIKTVTVQGKQVWSDPAGPPPGLTDRLLDDHHQAYHQKLARACRDSGALLGIDCHTMLAVAPAGSPTPGKTRPAFCISNCGNRRGEPEDGSATAPVSLMLAFQKNLESVFAPELAGFTAGEPRARINEPFRGGYITRHHGRNGPLPWIQLELSRALYLPEGARLDAPPNREMARVLTTIRGKILEALREVLKAGF